MLPGQVSQSALHAVTGDGVPHGLADHEAHPRRLLRCRIGRQMRDDGARTAAAATTDRLTERGTVGQAVSRGQHRADLGRPAAVRRRGSCGPCGGARTRSRGRRGCACAGGNRAPCDGGGCSAGTYACSRGSLHGVVRAVAPGRSGGEPFGWHRAPTKDPLELSSARLHCRGHAAPVDTGRPSNGTRWQSTGSNRRHRRGLQPVDDGLPDARGSCYVRGSRGSPPAIFPPPSGSLVTAITLPVLAH